MKKTIIIPVFMIVSITILIFVFFLFSRHSSSSKDNPNTYLTAINYSVQIGFNLIYLLIAIVVVLVAYNQLNKTREATTIQTLTNFNNNFRSNDFLKNRIRLAQFVKLNGIDELSTWMEKLKHKISLANEEAEEIAYVKNVFEAVIYEFEIIGYYYDKRIFTIEDVYQLFSIEIQQYWLLMEKLKFIRYLRENKQNPIIDYYDKFESLFVDTIKQEIKYELSFFQKHIYCSKSVQKKKVDHLLHKKRKILDQFLTEEKTLN